MTEILPITLHYEEDIGVRAPKKHTISISEQQITHWGVLLSDVVFLTITMVVGLARL